MDECVRFPALPPDAAKQLFAAYLPKYPQALVSEAFGQVSIKGIVDFIVFKIRDVQF